MPCYHPLIALQSLTPNHKGVRDISLQKKATFSGVIPHGYELLKLPCGQCIGCRLERSRQWAMRCVHELEYHNDSCFITLTYNDKYLPKYRSLSLDDFQLFMKRFRKKFKDKKIRFFHCGEYGERNERPHDHAIIFGFDFPDKKHLKTVNGYNVYTSQILEDLWGKGFCTIGDVTFESAAYVARYVLKKVTGEHAKYFYGKRSPEYVTMSRRDGIASKWYEEHRSEVYQYESGAEVVDCDEVEIRGRKMKPPRYYDNRLKMDSEEIYNYIKKARKFVAMLHEDDNTDERLADKEKIKNAQLKFLKRHTQFE